MYKRSTKTIVSLSTAFAIAFSGFQFVAPYHASAVSDTFTLTAVTNDLISVQLNGTPQVRLPNGVVTTANTNFRVGKNNTYTFVGIDGEVKTQKSLTMTSVPNQPELLIVSPGETVKLHFESDDAHSGVKDMRYRVYQEDRPGSGSIFTSWESYKAMKNYTIPSITKDTDSYWVVEAEFRDVAGNIKSNVITRFMIENHAPDVDLSNTPDWINKNDFESGRHSIHATGASKFGELSQIKYAVAPGSFQKWDNTIALTRPNLPQGYKETKQGDETLFTFTSEPYVIPIASDGYFNAFMQVVKMSNRLSLASDTVTKRIGLDRKTPSATAMLNSGENEASSYDVNLDIKNIYDELSGVETIEIFRVKDGVEERTAYATINNPSSTESLSIPFEEDGYPGGEKGLVHLYLTDVAGNRTSEPVKSQEVTFAKLSVTDFILTQNRNPKLYSDGFTPVSYAGKEEFGFNEELLSGSNFEFQVDYGLGKGNPSDYIIEGEYVAKFTKPDGTLAFSTGKLQRSSGTSFVSGKVGLDKDLPYNTIVEVEVNLTGVRKGLNGQPNRPIQPATPPAYKIGFVGKKNLSDVVNEAIRFNEVN